MNGILYATDYSDNSVAALKLANLLRKKNNCKLSVVHVFDISATFISTVSIAYARMEEAAYRDHHARLLEFCVKHIGRDAQTDGIDILIDQNSIASTSIIKQANKVNASLIIVGMKGSSAVREFLLGSTASALIEKSEVPVLTVPPDFSGTEFDKIVYATAFEEADIKAIGNVVEMVRSFNATIKLIHVSTKDEYAGEDQLQWFREMLNEKVTYENLNIELIFSDDIVKAIHQYLHRERPQLLVMLEREGHQLISNFWHRDLVKRMKLEADIPLMSFHKKYLMLQTQ